MTLDIEILITFSWGW